MRTRRLFKSYLLSEQCASAATDGPCGHFTVASVAKVYVPTVAGNEAAAATASEACGVDGSADRGLAAGAPRPAAIGDPTLHHGAQRVQESKGADPQIMINYR